MCRNPKARKIFGAYEELTCSSCGYRAQSRKEYWGASVREVWTLSYNDAEGINSCVIMVAVGVGPFVRLLY